jgi:hypothetical protein
VTACLLSQQLFSVTMEHAMPASQTLLGCATLPLECGTALLATLSAGTSDNEAKRLQAFMLDSQVSLVMMCMQESMEAGPGAERFAADPAAPEPLRAWLSAAVDATIALHGTSLGRGKEGSCVTLLAARSSITSPQACTQPPPCPYDLPWPIRTLPGSQ